jgi:DNA-binding transcriptional ArsR family regulator
MTQTHMNGEPPSAERLLALADAILGLFALPRPGGERGALGLGGADLTMIAFAVLISENDGRAMNPSKLSDYAGLPRATLYRKLDRLRRAGVIAPGDEAIRANPAFLDPERMVATLDPAAAVLVRSARVLGCDGGRDAGGLLRRLAESGRLSAACAVVAALGLDLARQSHVGPSPWFGGHSRNWLVRWSMIRAGATGARVSASVVAAETGLSRTAVSRQIAEVGRDGALVRDVDGVLGVDLLALRPAENIRLVARLGERVVKAVHSLSEMDGCGHFE